MAAKTVRARIKSSTSSGETPHIANDGVGGERAVELTAYNSYNSAKLPTAAPRRNHAEAPAVTVKVEAALHAGWVEFTDEGSGQRYFANEATGETSWTPPASELPTAAPRRNDAEASVVTVKVEAALPAGWVETTDEGSGQSYYANEATGETSWTLPASA